MDATHPEEMKAGKMNDPIVKMDLRKGPGSAKQIRVLAIYFCWMGGAV
jgi:hypothetical protein